MNSGTLNLAHPTQYAGRPIRMAAFRVDLGHNLMDIDAQIDESEDGGWIPDNSPEFDALPNRVDKMKYIVSHNAMQTIDGQPVDMQTAKAFLLVWDACGDTGKKKLETMPMVKAVMAVWRCIK